MFKLPLAEYIHHYSTGTKKKLLLFSALLLDKDIFIMDEPTNGLDLDSVELLKGILMELRKKGKTILISSHVMEVLTGICNRITLLKGINGGSTYEKENFDDLLQAVNHFYSDSHQQLQKLFSKL